MKKVLLFLFLFTVCCILIWFKEKSPALVKITLTGKKANITYLVEIADTKEKAEQGLMGRKSMPQNHGMLFVFPYPSIIKMWMKNTYIPLDMIFINAQNQVICTHENTRPLDESLISCPYPTSKVLELNAGEINQQNIQLGDILIYPDFFNLN